MNAHKGLSWVQEMCVFDVLLTAHFIKNTDVMLINSHSVWPQWTENTTALHLHFSTDSYTFLQGWAVFYDIHSMLYI